MSYNVALILKKHGILTRLLLTAILISGCTHISEPTVPDEMEYSIAEPPNVHKPEPVSLPSNLQNRCSGEEVLIRSDTDSARFEGCTVFVKASGISITRSEFINSRIFLESVSDVVFSDNVVRDYPVHEEAAIVVGISRDIVFRHNRIENNTVGIAVGESHHILIENNHFDSNYQHNAIAMYKSSGEVSGNLFRYNFPHGILVHFIPEHGATTVYIHDNIFFMNIEDAIDFEDWANARDESSISNNVITQTAWAGINIEYNSWDANILIENNHIHESGYPIEEFPRNPNASEEWTNGWGHGIKLEDCSGITVEGNTILDNNENGIDIRNCRNVTLRGNTVTGNDIGVFIGGPVPGSFTRDVSPLSEEHAGPSVVSYDDNYVFKNNEDTVEE
jgi:parallel beta-helix repeat protein